MNWSTLLLAEKGKVNYWYKRKSIVRLEEILHNGQYESRVFAAHCLGRLGDQRAVSPLLLALEDETFSVFEAVKEALAKLELSAQEQSRIDDRHKFWQAYYEELSNLNDNKSSALFIKNKKAALKDKLNAIKAIAINPVGLILKVA